MVIEAVPRPNPEMFQPSKCYGIEEGGTVRRMLNNENVLQGLKQTFETLLFFLSVERSDDEIQSIAAYIPDGCCRLWWG
ncbi:MAG: hypothetical protein R3C49_03650 [Planctomycetaceae bacterium]